MVWRPNERIAVPLITACFCICEFLRGLDVGVLPSILPGIAREFHTSSVDTYWTSSIYILSATIAEPIFAGLSQAIGRKFCLITSMCMFIVASVLCAMAQNITWLTGARLLQGVGAGGMDVSFSMILVDMVSLKQRPTYAAAIQIALALGLVSGALLGALVVQKGSWKWIFWANLPVTLVPLVILILILHIRQERKPTIEQIKSMDWVGIVLLSGSLISSLYAILSGGEVYPWGSARIVSLLIVGLVLFALFLIHEAFVAGIYIRPEPLIPLRLFSDRTAGIGYLIVVVQAIVMSSVAFYYPIYFFIVDGLSLVATAVRLLPTATTPFLCAALAAVIMIRLKKFKDLNLIGMTLLTSGMVAMSSLTEDSNSGGKLGYQFIYSIGLGILFPTRTMMIQVAQKKDSDVPMAASVAGMALNLGQCFGQALGSAVYQNEWDKLVNRAVRTGSISNTNIVSGHMVEQSFEAINTLPTTPRDQYRHIGAVAVGRIWLLMVGLCAFTLFASFFVRDMDFNRDTETALEFGGEDEIDEEKDIQSRNDYLASKEEIEPRHPPPVVVTDHCRN